MRLTTILAVLASAVVFVSAMQDVDQSTEEMDVAGMDQLYEVAEGEMMEFQDGGDEGDVDGGSAGGGGGGGGDDPPSRPRRRRRRRNRRKVFRWNVRV